MKIACFRFEAYSDIGAGHAMRSTVLADALIENGWDCRLVTNKASYDFIKNLERFKRVEPNDFYNNPLECDLFVIDHYGLDHTYESHFRRFAKKIMVIDDLADRKHDCDILLDQTFGRTAKDYKPLVPDTCEILAGSDYVLLRKDFINLRPKALEKRKNTTEVKRILVSLGGSDPENFTLKALQMIKESDFKGAIDIVLGFSSPNIESVKKYADGMENDYIIHTDVDMPTLIYEADLAIGAAGSSVWERCCLGLPQVLMVTADNQKLIYKKLIKEEGFFESLSGLNYVKNKINLCDGFGIIRLINFLEKKRDKLGRKITHHKMKLSDLNEVFNWQKEPNLRKFCMNTSVPTYQEHAYWFQNEINNSSAIYEKIKADGYSCGILHLKYILEKEAWLLSWYVSKAYQGSGIGTLVLNFAIQLVSNKKIYAHVVNNNFASNRAMQKANFRIINQQDNINVYEY
jgi:UDP-2,4-diacetamido-2,4,6-trideoxy-beta-L-altropyranose hydrolase